MKQFAPGIIESIYGFPLTRPCILAHITDIISVLIIRFLACFLFLFSCNRICVAISVSGERAKILFQQLLMSFEPKEIAFGRKVY
jgi:hypothetical protein